MKIKSVLGHEIPNSNYPKSFQLTLEMVGDSHTGGQSITMVKDFEDVREVCIHTHTHSNVCNSVTNRCGSVQPFAPLAAGEARRKAAMAPSWGG